MIHDTPTTAELLSIHFPWDLEIALAKSKFNFYSANTQGANMGFQLGLR